MAFCGSMPAATAALAAGDGRLLVAVHDGLLELPEDRGFVCHLVSSW